MGVKIAKDVDSYIADAANEARPVLKQLRTLFKSVIPKAQESISWGVPFYRYNGLIGGYAVYKKHASFGLASVIDDKEKEALEKKGYKTGSKTIQIKFDQEVPAAVIKRMLKAQVKMNEDKS